ncbi:UrcA family protein [Sphingosinicella terrae]|uniref:UrcA family protein n=1 Tax=Sphingosinicella terrae TaxID=2172047 RepID=UPI0013B3DC8A|nr:UrcA family protein [Sphingosinicella terrae]
MLRPSTLLAALLAAAASVTAVAAVPAVAAPPAAPTRTVSFADLNLDAAAGRSRLAQRLRAAVRSVCGTAFPADLRAQAEMRDCRADSLAAIGADRRAGRVDVSEVAGTR